MNKLAKSESTQRASAPQKTNSTMPAAEAAKPMKPAAPAAMVITKNSNANLSMIKPSHTVGAASARVISGRTRFGNALPCIKTGAARLGNQAGLDNWLGKNLALPQFDGRTGVSGPNQDSR